MQMHPTTNPRMDPYKSLTGLPVATLASPPATPPSTGVNLLKPIKQTISDQNNIDKSFGLEIDVQIQLNLNQNSFFVMAIDKLI